MKIEFITGVMAAAVLMAGCTKKDAPAAGSAPPPNAQPDAVPQSPFSPPGAMSREQIVNAIAVSSFVHSDWSVRPLFAEGSVLNLSEDQFKALSDTDRQAKSKEMLAQLGSLKQLGAAVAQAGRDAAAKGDIARARTYFMSLKQCGTALDSPECLKLVQLVGQAFKKLSNKEIAKLGP